MERAAFLLDATGEQLSCLLNPNELVFRRTAGLTQRRSLSGTISGSTPSDDPLLFTGGGTTELTLDLLFDVSLAGSSIRTEDVRDLTRPLVRLAESGSFEQGQGRPPLVRFVWGKAWNFPGVVAALTERLEDFLLTGVPRRSWMRMRLLRVVEQTSTAAPMIARGPAEPLAEPLGSAMSPLEIAAFEQAGADTAAVHVVLGDGGAQASGERLDLIAATILGNASLWRLLAALNGIDDPLHVPAGTVLRLPPRTLSGSRTP